MRNEVKDPILLDSGDLLFHDFDYGDNPDVSLAIQGKKIIESYNAMKWTALGLGEKDFALGTEYLKDLAKTADFPFLAANVLDAKTNKYVFKPYVIVKVNGFRVGITSVIGTNTDFSAGRQEKLGIYVADPVNSLSSVIKEMDNKADFIVVLAHTGLNDAKILAKSLDHIDLIIVGHSGELNLYQPLTEENTLITEVFERGKYIDRLDFAITKPTRPFEFYVEGSESSGSLEHQELVLRKKQLEIFQSDIEAQKKAGKDVASIEKVVTEEMKQVDERLEEMGEATKTDHANTVKPTLIALDSNIPDDPTVLGIFKKYAEELEKIKKQEKQSLLEEGGLTTAALSVEPHYVGKESCATCHAKIYSFVETTAHPKAYETLVKKERQYEPNCIGCHTTGYNKPGGFTNVLAARGLLGVQCEDCHGPGSQHLKDNKTYKMKFLTAKADCVSCHDPENDGNFVYETKLAKIKCPAK